jgi:hypothetical protein
VAVLEHDFVARRNHLGKAAGKDKFVSQGLEIIPDALHDSLDC